jgi:hypothetical protein
MKTILIILIASMSFTSNAFDEVVSTDNTTEICKTKAKYKRAKRRSQRRHGIYHSACMKTKRIRVK